MNSQKNTPDSNENFSVLMVLCAYFIWGFLVLYMWLLNSVSPFEVVVHRAFWACILLWGYALLKGQFFTVLAFFKSIEKLKFLIISTILLTLNWSIFVYAISIGNALDTSVAYFITPTLQLVFALTLFKEKLNPLQWFSMIFIFLALAVKFFSIGTLPYLSVSIALTWTLYGIIQKKIAMPVFNKLTIETTLSVPFLLFLFWFWIEQTQYQPSFNFEINSINLLLFGSGIITIVPLLFFNFGVKKTPFKWVSILQYLVPSMSFLIAIFVFKEKLDLLSFTSFVLIWIGMFFFILAQLRENKKNKIPH